MNREPVDPFTATAFVICAFAALFLAAQALRVIL